MSNVPSPIEVLQHSDPLRRLFLYKKNAHFQLHCENVRKMRCSKNRKNIDWNATVMDTVASYIITVNLINIIFQKKFSIKMINRNN